MPFERSSGILLHLSSLPSRGGIGDPGPAAFQFLDFLAEARQTLWQMLPLNPPGLGNSPYAATSAFAGNPLLVSLEELARRDWIGWDRLHALLPEHGNTDFEEVARTKIPLLREAAERFLRKSDDDKAGFLRFSLRNVSWLDDYVLFAVLREKFGLAPWNEWPRDVMMRDPGVLEQLRAEHRHDMDIEKAIQYAFFDQIEQLRLYAKERQIRIIGDVAIFVSYDSADVWTHPELFYLDDDRRPIAVAGVPPDFFSETGQRWGNPLYRWDVLRQSGYSWWVQRLQWALESCDLLRLDHFLGFEAYWEIPAEEETAVNGRWVPGPGHDFFATLRRTFGKLPFIAEDLGLITPAVEQLRRDFDLPGMRVLQFGFSGRGAHIFLPHQYEPNTVVYTGTHDNDTTLGWWNKAASPAEKQAVQAYLDPESDAVVDAFVRAAETSVADLCIVPMQDILGLDSDARMNTPATSDGNWTWRYSPGALTSETASRLAALMEVCDRDPRPAASSVVDSS